MLDATSARPDVERVTLCLNTVDRPYCVQRLIKSVRAVYPSLAIILADQNPPNPAMEAFYAEMNVKVVRTPYRSGVSHGRNTAARQVETEFILYCDDDFLFSEETNFSPLIRIFEADPEVDILGGLVRDIPGRLESDTWQVRRWEVLLIRDRARGLLLGSDIDFFLPRRKEVAGTPYFLTDTVLLWKLCRRETVERGAVFDPRFICNGDHEDFYLNVKENTDVKVAYCPSMIVYHHSPEDFAYGPLRNAVDGFKLLGEKWGLSEYLEPHMALRRNYSRGQTERPPHRTRDPLLLPVEALFPFDREQLGSARPKSWPVTEAAQAGLRPDEVQISILAGPADITPGQHFSLIFQINNRSAESWGCLGAHAPEFGYSASRAATHEALGRGRLSTRLTQDIAAGVTFHYVNVYIGWRALPGEAVDLCVELRRPDGSTVAMSSPHRLVISDVAERYVANLRDGIDFRREGQPEFLRAMFGLSHAEGWGRWSDADLGETIEFHFKDELPDIFDLVLECKAFGPNARRPAIVRVGNCTGTFTVSETTETIRLRLRPMTRTSQITIDSPCPTRPADQGGGNDRRRLGIGFISMKIEN
jgi:GT2 family glycosyltransferase